MMRTALRTGLLAIAVIAVLGAAEARSALIVQSAVETPTTLKVELGWNPEASDFLSVPNLLYWVVNVSTATSLPEDIFYTVNVRHLPDGPEVGLGGVFKKTALGVVSSAAASDGHGVGAQDKYTVTFFRSAVPANNLITITGAHVVPEPSTALLGLAGLGLLAGARVIRRRMS